MTYEIREMIKKLDHFSHHGDPARKATLDLKIKEARAELDSFIGTRIELRQKDEEIDRHIDHLKREDLKIHSKEIESRWDEIRKLLNIQHGVQNHPKKDLAWEIARSMGMEHVNYAGYTPIVQAFEELVELLK